MFTEDDRVILPDWYVMDKVAERLRYTARDFMQLPEPDFTYWYNRGIAALEAEGEAWQANHPKQA